MITNPSAAGVSHTSIDERRIRRSRFAFLVVALMWPSQLLTASGVVGGVAQPAMAQAFQTTQIAWFALAYTLAATLFTPFVVKLGDIVGKKNVMVAIAAVGLIGDLIVVLAPSFDWVIVGRVVAGMYGPIAALAFAAARDIFPPRQVGTATGIIGAGLGLVTLFAPFIAGFLLVSFGFHGPLWFIVGGATVALLLLLGIPKIPSSAPRTSFDVLGGLLLGIGLVALVLVIGQAQTWGPTSALTIGVALLGVVALVLFVLWERRATNPIFSVEMLRRRNIGLVLISSSIISGAVYAGAILPTFLALFPAIPGLSAGLGWDAVKIAAVMAPSALITFLVGFFVGRLARRIDLRVLWIAGATLAAAGFVLLAFFHAGVLDLILCSSVLGIGTGLIVATAPVLILGSVSMQEQGMANGMSILLNNLMIAVIGQVLYTVLAVFGSVSKGALFYSDASFRNAWIAMAVFVVIGLLVALGIPKLLRPDDVETGSIAVTTTKNA